MTLRARVLVVAVAALAVIGVLASQLVLRYAQARQSLTEVVEVLAPASVAAADLAGDLNSMERRLRLYAADGDRGFGLLYDSAVRSAQENLADLEDLVGGRDPYADLLDDVEASMTAWLDGVGVPAESAIGDGDLAGAMGILNSPQAQSAYVQLTADTARLSTLLTKDQELALADSAAAARRLAWTMGLALVVMMLIPLASYVALRQHVLLPISRLRAQLRAAATPGRHDSVIVPDGPPELRDLGSDAEALRRALVHEIDQSEAARKSLEQEGPVVDAIRHELAARSDPGPAGVQIAGVLRPAEGVLAGDFWDRITLTDGRAAAVVCDVSGHGPRAGIVAMRMKTAITQGLLAGQDPPQILHRACDAFADDPGRFATVVILIADPPTGRLEWVNGGHPAARIVRADGRIERLAPTGPMVSWLVGAWTTGVTHLGPDDLCLAFTDGILESRDAAGEELGDDGLDAALRAAARASADPAEVTALVLGGVRQRTEDIDRDDVTLVALRWDATEAVRAIPTPRR